MNYVLNLNQRDINTFIYLNEYVLLHYDCDHYEHGQFVIRAFLNALWLCPLILRRKSICCVNPITYWTKSKNPIIAKSENKVEPLIFPSIFYRLN